MAPVVLVVEPDPVMYRRIGDWLEGEGFEVMICPGPSRPGYTCLASEGDPCPLEEIADVVVLDMHLASDDALIGTPGWELLLYYMERGDRIVVLSGLDDAVRPRADDRVAVLRRPVERNALVGAVRRLCRSTTGGGRGKRSAR